MSGLADRISGSAIPGERYVVAISGAPGSGKTTLAAQVAEELVQKGRKAVQIAMDGFHYTRAELDEMEDPENAHRYRGAPFTFDLFRIKDFASKLHTRERLVAPLFDHAKKDPDVNGRVIDPDVDIIIFEGNYLLLNIDGWDELATYWDDRCILFVNEQTLRERLAKRHLAAGLVSTIEDGYARADFNDIPNGRLLVSNSTYDYAVGEEAHSRANRMDQPYSMKSQ